MRSRTRKTLLLLALAAFVCAVAGRLAYKIWDRREMLRVTLKWGRLAPLPASARQFAIIKSGSMFSRVFHASFTAPRADIERWLRESPGTRDLTPERPSPTTRRFVISPGAGAQRAEVTIEDNSGIVRIYVAWS